MVENGLRHTPPGTRITVSVGSDCGEGCSLIVQDDGPGVHPSDMLRLIDRFYRAERSRTTPGNGLGLSLVVAVADLHEAALHIETNAPGLRVRMVFRISAACRLLNTVIFGEVPRE